MAWINSWKNKRNIMNLPHFLCNFISKNMFWFEILFCSVDWFLDNVIVFAIYDKKFVFDLCRVSQKVVFFPKNRFTLWFFWGTILFPRFADYDLCLTLSGFGFNKMVLDIMQAENFLASHLLLLFMLLDLIPCDLLLVGSNHFHASRQKGEYFESFDNI